MTMLRLPEDIGPTSLAYITDAERKLLRRRDAVKGRKVKSTKEGIPYLGPDDPMPETKHSKKYNYKTQYASMADPKKDYKKYVQSYGDLSKAYDKIVNKPTSESAKYWKPRMANMSMEAFGKAHAGESKALEIGKYRGATKAMGSKARSVPSLKKKKIVKQPPEEPPVVTRPGPDPTDPTGGSDAWNTTIDTSQLQQPLLEEIVMIGPKSEVLQERLKDLINTNSPLFKAATTKALQSMNSVGLTNSSIAQEAVMSSILAVAIPIAQQDAQTFLQQRLKNQDASNAFKMAQNAAYYEAFITNLQGQINKTLRQLAERSANWRAVLGERGRIAVTPGMSKSAAENAFKAVTPEWF